MNAVGEWVGRIPFGRSAPRGERPSADHPHLRRGVLERVIGAGEQVLVGLGRGIAPTGSELRFPEGAQVRLVADDHGVRARYRPRDRGSELRELLALGSVPRRVPPETVPDDDEQTHVRTLRRPGRVQCPAQAPRRRCRQAGLPRRRERERAEARAARKVDGRVGCGPVLLGQRVVDHADGERVQPRAVRRGRGRQLRGRRGYRGGRRGRRDDRHSAGGRRGSGNARSRRRRCRQRAGRRGPGGPRRALSGRRKRVRRSAAVVGRDDDGRHRACSGHDRYPHRQQVFPHWAFLTGLSSRGRRLPLPGHGQACRRATEGAPDQVRRLPFPRLAGRSAVRRQGEVAAAARAQLLPGRAPAGVRRSRSSRSASRTSR